MPKFKRRPVTTVIEAHQFHKNDNRENRPIGVCHGHLYADCSAPKVGFGGTFGIAPSHVHTIREGQTVLLEDGDWILPEPDGIHFYPVKPEIFEATYELVDERPLAFFDSGFSDKSEG